MHMVSKTGFILSGALLGLAACDRAENPATTISKPVAERASRATPKPIRPAPSSTDFVARAAAIDLFEIQSAKLALERSGRGSVRDFATMEIQAHQGTSAQLALAGRRLNLLPARALTPEYSARLEELSASSSFDLTYKNQQLAVHQQALALHQAYAARGASPTLRPVASAAVPLIQRHLRLLRYL